MRYISIFYPDLHTCDIDAVLRGIRLAGATVLHTTLAWSVIEPTPGKFDFAAYAQKFEQLAAEGLEFVVTLDSSSRFIFPVGRIVNWQQPMARPDWLAGELSYDIFARDFYGEMVGDLDVFDALHLPLLQRFYDEALQFLCAAGHRVLSVLPGITTELEIKFGQDYFCWRSFSRAAMEQFENYLSVGGLEPKGMPVSNFNNSLVDWNPRYQENFAAMMKFREQGVINYIAPLCKKIRNYGFRTAGYFGQFFTYQDAVYASGVVECGQTAFDVACFDYNYYDGVNRVREPWVMPTLINFGRHLGYKELQIGLYVERYRDFSNNKLDPSIMETVRSTLENIDDEDDVIGLEIGGIEVDDLHAIRSFGIGSRRGFDLGGYLPKTGAGAIRIAVLASLDTHYLWHGDYSCDRDQLHDLLRETYRILRQSREFDVSLLSARMVGQGTQSIAGFDAVLLPHTLAMDDELIECLVKAKRAGVKIVQDVGAGNFTPDGLPRDLHRLYDLFGLTEMVWCREPGRFRHRDQIISVDVAAPEQQYFTYVRLAVGAGGTIQAPELENERVGLVACHENALTFGFLPQLCACDPGKLFWETLFVDTIARFVRV